MFRNVLGFSNYEVSKNGVIRNKKTKRVKKQYIGSTGYYMVTFSVKNKSNPKRVHRIIANAFIENNDKKPDINHIDGNKLNNNIENLEWVTHKENMTHAFGTGLVDNLGSKNGMAKLNEVQVIEIKQLLKKGLSQYKIAAIFNVSRSTILMIKLEKRWGHIQLKEDLNEL